jgi:hypothetical protein
MARIKLEYIMCVKCSRLLPDLYFLGSNVCDICERSNGERSNG